MTAAPELASTAQALFDAHTHKVLATLRKDGSPRVSGIETTFASGQVWLGMMAGSLKAGDLRRDPRFALHSASTDPPDDPTAWVGDAKLAGRCLEVSDPSEVEGYVAATGAPPPGPSGLFRLDIGEVVVTRVGDPPDHLVIESWHEGEGIRQVRRA